MDYKKLLFNRLNIYLLLLVAVFSRVIYTNVKDLTANNIEVGTNSSIVIAILLILTLTYCIRNRRYWTLLVLLGLTALVYLKIITRFSPIDESVHFDYINQIIKYKRLPYVGDTILTELFDKLNFINITGSPNYELVHPPTYYLACSLVGLFVSNILVRFYLIRALGAVFTGMVIFFIYNTYKLLCEKDILKKNDPAFILCLIIFFFSSGFLVRMLTISNESLAVLIVTATFYQMIRIILSDTITKKDIIIVSILLTLAVLTKITTVYIGGILFLVLLYKKKITSILYTIGIGIVGTMPWVIMNIIRYGSVTGTKKHLEIVLPIANPSNTNVVLVDTIKSFPRVISTFWFPEEAGGALARQENLFVIYLMGFISMILIMILIKNILNLLEEILRKKITAKGFIFGIFSISILLNLFMLVYGSVSTNVNIMLGRYLYLTLLPFVFLSYSVVSKIDKKNFLLITMFILMFSVMNNELVVKEFLANIDISKYKDVSKNIFEVVIK